MSVAPIVRSPRWSPLSIVGINGYLDPRLQVTVDGSNRVLDIVDQAGRRHCVNNFSNPPPPVGSVPAGDNTPWLPTLVPAAFGALPGLLFAPDRGAVKAQWVRIPQRQLLPNGLSWFWICRYTENRTISNHNENGPMTVVSESSHDTFSGAGFSNGSLMYHFFGNFMSSLTWHTLTFGSGFNDDVPRLYGVTHSTTGDVKAYVNGIQVDATVSGVDYWNSPAVNESQSWSAYGTGYAADPGIDIYGGDDGFAGHGGPLVVVSGIISPSDLAMLNAWSQSEGWIP